MSKINAEDHRTQPCSRCNFDCSREQRGRIGLVVFLVLAAAVFFAVGILGMQGRLPQTTYGLGAIKYSAATLGKWFVAFGAIYTVIALGLTASAVIKKIDIHFWDDSRSFVRL